AGRAPRPPQRTPAGLVHAGHVAPARPELLLLGIQALGQVEERRLDGPPGLASHGTPGSGRGDGDPLLPEARRLAGALAQVVELGAPDVARLHHLDPLDPRRMEREGPLDADAVGHAPDREAGPGTLPALADHDALEDLHALLLALHDLGVHPHGVAGLERPAVPLQDARFDDRDRIHDVAPLHPGPTR